jgi:enoyl-CoA hydratase/carnithine racemase
MIRELSAIYDSLENSNVRCVVLRGEGRALCAGGDVTEVREGVLDGGPLPADFFFEEYTLDYQIATLKERRGIQHIALWDGIVMGGGVGLSIHSPIKIATEKTLFAMPETGIGLFPDVGMTWLLSRLASGKALGLYLGLTGQRLKAADCLYAGLATHYCPSDQLANVTASLEGLGGEAASDPDMVTKVISEAANGAAPETEGAVLAANADAIERYFGGASSIGEIMSRVESDGGSSAFAAGAKKLLSRMSPTSLKVSLEAIQRHQDVDLRQAFVTEYRVSQHCMRPQPLSDFTEGIRALLVDKDNKPAWLPATLEEVDAEHVEGFFAPLPAGHRRGELAI